MTAGDAERAREVAGRVKRGRDQEFADLEDAPSALRRIRRYSRFTDELVASLFGELAPSVAARGAVVVALGGYGRRELYPHSDLDLMVLSEREWAEEAEEEVARAFRVLWDARLTVGHAVRTRAEACEILHRDEVSATALLEGRVLSGRAALWEEFRRREMADFVASEGHRYLRGRLRQLRSRRDFYGRAVARKEPNLKEAPGGLRDLHEARWVWRVLRQQGAELPAHSPLSGRELCRAFDWVARLRCLLHRHADRRQDHLSFELQRELGPCLGFGDRPHSSAAEQLMRETLRKMRHIEEAARTAEEWAERRIAPRRVLVRRRVDGPFVAVGDRLYVQTEEELDLGPPGLTLLHAFCLARRLHLKVSAELGTAIRHRARQLPASFRDHPEAGAMFRELFLGRGNVAETLADLHRFGVLAAYIPEFAEADALVREEPYHRWALDEHLIRSVAEVDALERGGGDAERRAILRRVARPDLLKLALFLHDLGKIRRGRHVERARTILPDLLARLGTGADDASTVQWLVDEHLTLMHAQRRRDLNDPAALGELGSQIGSGQRLHLLYLVTVCDSRATSASALPAWLDTMLLDTYRRLDQLFASGAAESRSASFADDAAQRSPDPRVREHLGAMPRRYRYDLTEELLNQHLRLADEVTGSGLERSLALSHRPVGDAREVWVVCRDRPGRFAELAAALTANRLAVVSADLFTRSDGMVFDRFLVVPVGGGDPGSARFWSRLREDFAALPGRPGGARGLVAARASYLEEAAAEGPVLVRLDSELSEKESVLELEAPDQPGLLFRVADVLQREGVEITRARISTIGDRASDYFYVRTAAGKLDPDRDEGRLRDAIARALDPGTVDSGDPS